MEPHISVVVCAKNEENFIKNCLAALDKQILRPEIIVIDGKSTDETVTIAKKYADVIKSDGGNGIAYARNMGWKLAKEEIVAYCDADARPPKDWTKKVIEFIGNNAAVYGPIIPYDGNLKTRINLKIWGDIFMWLGSKIGYPIICAANVAFRKDMLKKHPFRFNAPTEDFDVGRRMRHSGRIKFFKELAMPVSARRYENNFYRKVAIQYLTNYILIKMGKEPKNFGYFEKH